MNNIDQFISIIKSGDYVFPDALARYLKIPLVDAYLMLQKRTDIQAVYAVRCPICQERIGIFESIEKIPDVVNCIKCDKEIEDNATDKNSNVYVCYQKL